MNRIIFGAFVTEGWHISKKFFGEAESFLFTFLDESNKKNRI